MLLSAFLFNEAEFLKCCQVDLALLLLLVCLGSFWDHRLLAKGCLLSGHAVHNAKVWRKGSK